MGLIAKYRENRDGCGAWKQLLTANTDSGAQYEDAQKVLTWLKTHKWKDTGNILLKSHVAQHRRSGRTRPEKECRQESSHARCGALPWVSAQWSRVPWCRKTS